MREPAYYGPRISFTVALLIINGVVFLIQLIAANTAPAVAGFIDQYFILSLPGLLHGFVWQLLTFQFLHAGLMHIICNSLAIYFFGQPVENAVGRRHFLILYLTSGVIGGLVQMLFSWLAPDHFGLAVLGASAGASGLVAAFAIMHWRERFNMLIYFIPMSMTGKTLLAANLLIAFVGVFFPNSGIANAAHLGGILAGAYYVRFIIQGEWPRWKFPIRRSTPRKLVASRADKGSFWRSAGGKSDDDSSDDDFLSNEVDPILEKISAHGIHSLTARERDILEKARKKMTGR